MALQSNRFSALQSPSSGEPSLQSSPGDIAHATNQFMTEGREVPSIYLLSSDSSSNGVTAGKSPNGTPVNRHAAVPLNVSTTDQLLSVTTVVPHVQGLLGWPINCKRSPHPF